MARPNARAEEPKKRVKFTLKRGDTVRVQECRPMSATKRWRLLEIVERAR